MSGSFDTSKASNGTSAAQPSKTPFLLAVIVIGVVAVSLIPSIWQSMDRQRLQHKLNETNIVAQVAENKVRDLSEELASAKQRSSQASDEIQSLRIRLAVEQSRTEKLREISNRFAQKLPMKYKNANLIFVSFDALQAAHVGFLGYPRNVTPTIDSIAEQSFAFRKAYSVASWTVPSTMTWFTGVYPSEHGMVNRFAKYDKSDQKLAHLSELAPDLVTLAELLKSNGYVTGGFTGNAGVSGDLGYDEGFDVYYYPKGTFGGLGNSVPRALMWLKENKDKKFFLFLHGYDVHGQSAPPEGYDYRYVDKRYDKKYLGLPREQEVLREEGLEKGKLTMRDEDVRFWRAIYDEKINRADAQFKRFLAELDKLEVTNNTLFVLTSDHGTEFYEHRRFDHGFTLYDELIHVPLFIKLPGQTYGGVSDVRISSIDIMPTILELLDVNVPAKLEKQFRGKSLVAVMQGKPASRDVFSETDYREYTYKRSIITTDGWKLIYTLEDSSRELYNLEHDPGETKDLVDKEQKRADDLQKRLFAHFKSIGHNLTSRRWIRGLNPVYSSQGKPKQ